MKKVGVFYGTQCIAQVMFTSSELNCPLRYVGIEPIAKLLKVGWLVG